MRVSKGHLFQGIYGIAAGWVIVSVLVAVHELLYGTLLGAIGWLVLCSGICAAAFLGYRIQQVEHAVKRIVGTKYPLVSREFVRVLAQFRADQTVKELVYFPELIERKVSSKEELSFALEKLVSAAHSISGAVGTELALFDREAKQYHSSITLGRPFRESIDEFLLNPPRTQSQHVVLETIAFAGTVLGTLRILLPKDAALSDTARAALRLLSTYASMALVNADFVSELLKMRRLSDDSVRARTGFLASLSHELRAPLGVILNGTELMREGILGSISEDQRETLGMLHSQGRHLLDLLNDVLDYAKLESGKVTPSPVTLPAAEIVLECASVLRSQAVAKGQKLTVDDIPDDLWVRVDRKHFRQILINLLSNAVKYTPDGGTVRVKVEAQKGERIRFTVSDTGVGIDAGDHEKVFSPFERVEKGYAAKQSGTGLGLALTKKLIERNGGSIGFESAAGKGSSFWFLLPSGEASRLEVQPEAQGEKCFGKGVSVILVCQRSNEAQLIRKFLDARLFSVDEVHTSAELGELLGRRAPSVIILDESAESYLGAEMPQLIRAMSKGTYHPLILLSGRAFSFDVEDELRAGVDRHISKPFEFEALARLVIELNNHESRMTRKIDPVGGEQVH